jgi:post-segregation antitoxin (ccd killing protein)
MASRRQANFLLSEELIEELRRSVGKREQSQFVEAALQKELKRLKLERSLEGSFGAWKDKNHPEIRASTEQFVRKLRKTTREKRLAR